MSIERALALLVFADKPRSSRLTFAGSLCGASRMMIRIMSRSMALIPLVSDEHVYYPCMTSNNADYFQLSATQL
jgi:hypothetical protein